MTLDSTIFRENDIRGLVDPSLTPSAVYAIGRAYATILTEAGAKAVAVGGDVRLSTPEIKANLIRAIRDGGIHVVDIGTVTTPVSYYAAFEMQIDGAAMITATTPRNTTVTRPTGRTARRLPSRTTRTSSPRWRRSPTWT